MAAGLGTVVVGGGSGFIGNALVSAFSEIGSRVHIVSRKPGAWRVNWHDITSHGLPPDTRVVINVAGQDVLNPRRGWSAGFRQNVIASRINTTSTLASAIVRAHQEKKSKLLPDVFITISGVGYYPPSIEADYDEYSEGGIKTDFFSNLAREWEEAGNLPDSIPVRRVVIRSGVVLGLGGGIMRSIWMPFFLGVGGRIASGKQHMPWIHLQDLVRMFIFAAQEPHVTGILNGVSPQVVTNYEFTKALGKAMWRPTVFPLPETVINVMFGPERARMLTQGQKVHPKRVLDLGFEYEFPDLVKALRNVVMTPAFQAGGPFD